MAGLLGILLPGPPTLHPRLPTLLCRLSGLRYSSALAKRAGGRSSGQALRLQGRTASPETAVLIQKPCGETAGGLQKDRRPWEADSPPSLPPRAGNLPALP